jgi:hypothetical protein
MDLNLIATNLQMTIAPANLFLAHKNVRRSKTARAPRKREMADTHASGALRFKRVVVFISHLFGKGTLFRTRPRG